MSCGPISALDGRVAESFVVPSLLKVRCKLPLHMQLQEQDMRFTKVEYTHRE